jgi:hypothetical protein
MSLSFGSRISRDRDGTITTPSKALFGTRGFVGISGDNSLEYWVKPLPSPNPPQNPTHNPLGRGRVLEIDKNTPKFGEKWG